MYVYHFIHIWVYVYVKFWRSTTALDLPFTEMAQIYMPRAVNPRVSFPIKCYQTLMLINLTSENSYFGVVLIGISHIVSEGEFSYLIAIMFPFINLSLLLSFVYFSTLFLFFTWLICSKFSFLWAENIFSGLLCLLILLIMVFSMQKCLCLCKFTHSH